MTAGFLWVPSHIWTWLKELALFLRFLYSGDPAKSMLWFADHKPPHAGFIYNAVTFSQSLNEKTAPCTLWLPSGSLTTITCHHSDPQDTLAVALLLALLHCLRVGSPVAGESCLEKWESAPSTEAIQDSHVSMASPHNKKASIRVGCHRWWLHPAP